MTEQMNQFMPNSDQQFDPADIERNKAIAGLSYLGILFFLPLVAAPESRYGRFHANQSLILLIASFASWIVFWILGAIFIAIGIYFLATILYYLSVLVSLGIFVLYIMGLINGFTGKAKEMPIIGKIKIIK